MNILLISNMYPNGKFPSYGVFVRNTEKILQDQGSNIDRVVMYKTSSKFKKIYSYIKHYCNVVLKGMSDKYDIIYVHYASHNALPLIFLKKIKPSIKIYTNVHGSDVVPETQVQSYFQIYVKKLLQLSDRVITPSFYYKDLVRNKYSLENKEIEVFPSGGIDTAVFYPIEDKTQIFNELGLDEKQQYIGYVGRIDYKKGWDIFLEAVHLLKEEKKLHDKKIIIVGNGKQEDQFDEFIKQYDLTNYIVRFNLAAQEKLNKIYNCMDVFCFPTMREGESLGLVGLEAMACGVPVIGSNIGGLKDYIIDNKNGLFFKTGDSKMLKEKIEEYFLFDKAVKENMKIEAKKTAQKYEVNNVKKLLLKIFSA